MIVTIKSSLLAPFHFVLPLSLSNRATYTKRQHANPCPLCCRAESSDVCEEVVSRQGVRPRAAGKATNISEHGLQVGRFSSIFQTNSVRPTHNSLDHRDGEEYRSPTSTSLVNESEQLTYVILGSSVTHQVAAAASGDQPVPQGQRL